MKVIWYNQSLKDVSELATLDVLSKVLKSLNLVDLSTKGKLFKIYFFQIKVLKPSGPSVFNFTIFESTLRKKNYSISCQENQTRTIPSSRKKKWGWFDKWSWVKFGCKDSKSSLELLHKEIIYNVDSANVSENTKVFTTNPLFITNKLSLLLEALSNCDSFTLITILVSRKRSLYFCSRSVYHVRLTKIPSTVK